MTQQDIEATLEHARKLAGVGRFNEAVRSLAPLDNPAKRKLSAQIMIQHAQQLNKAGKTNDARRILDRIAKYPPAAALIAELDKKPVGGSKSWFAPPRIYALGGVIAVLVVMMLAVVLLSGNNPNRANAEALIAEYCQDPNPNDAQLCLQQFEIYMNVTRNRLPDCLADVGSDVNPVTFENCFMTIALSQQEEDTINQQVEALMEAHRARSTPAPFEITSTAIVATNQAIQQQVNASATAAAGN